MCGDQRGTPFFFLAMERNKASFHTSLKRPNTVRFYARDIGVTPEEAYYAVNREIKTTDTMKCIAELDSGWFNITFDNGKHCEDLATHGLRIQGVIVECERVTLQNSVVAYIKVPFEMSDHVVTSALMEYGTVTNIRRQVHQFDSNIETGVRSMLIKNIRKPIPSYIRVGNFTLPVRHKGQEKTCRICQQPGHVAGNCDKRGRCYICGDQNHRAVYHHQKEGDRKEERNAWHKRNEEEEEQSEKESIVNDEINLIQEDRETSDDEISLYEDYRRTMDDTEAVSEASKQIPEATDANTAKESEIEDEQPQPKKKRMKESQEDSKEISVDSDTPKPTPKPRNTADTTKKVEPARTKSPQDESHQKRPQRAQSTQKASSQETTREPESTGTQSTPNANDHSQEMEEEMPKEETQEDFFMPCTKKGAQSSRKRRGSGAASHLGRNTPYPSTRGRGRGKRDS